MTRKTRDQAERLSRYVDRLLASHQGPAYGSVDSVLEEGDFQELCELASTLSGIRIQPPAALAAELAVRLSLVREKRDVDTAGLFTTKHPPT